MCECLGGYYLNSERSKNVDLVAPLKVVQIHRYILLPITGRYAVMSEIFDYVTIPHFGCWPHWDSTPSIGSVSSMGMVLGQ
jgi:hypothetical protein